MRKTKKSKILSFVLCMSMIISTFAFMPQTAAAEESTAENDIQQVTESAEPSSSASDSESDSTVDNNQTTDDSYTDNGNNADKNADNGDTDDSELKTVDFTKAAPLLDPVEGKSTSVVKKLFAKVASLFSTANTAAVANDAAAADDTDNADKVDNDGVVTSKSVTKNDDGSYKIRLESYVTGASTTTTVTEAVPTDIVLVLDQSGSMAESFGSDEYIKVYDLDKTKTYYVENNQSWSSSYRDVSWCSTCNAWTYECQNWWGYHIRGTSYTPKTSDSSSGTQFYEYQQAITKLQALKNAATSFCNSVAEKTKGADGVAGNDDDVDHRIAIVGFGSDNSNQRYYYTNTELFNGSTQTRYDNLKDTDYQNAFQNMSTTNGQNNIKASIAALAAEGATRADLGMDMAKNILDKNPVASGQKRNRVVIMFTDGSPTSSNGFELNVANNAITKSGEIKTAGATVYSVGIFTGADATSAGTKPSGDLGSSSSSLAAACNWFMQNFSSNNGTPKTPSYYLSAGNSTALSSIFEEISSQIETGGASVTLGTETVVKDIVSDYFELPEGTAAENITLKTADVKTYDKESKTATWKDEVDVTDDSGISASIEGKTVKVTGFDFSANYVGVDKKDNVETVRGKKLIIEFDVKVRDGFLGGSNVTTNGADSGIYTKKDGVDTVVENFDQPVVNIPVSEITATAADKNVYLAENLSSSDIRSDITVKVGNTALDLTKENYGLAAWQNAFVDISVSAKDKSGNDIFADGYSGMNNLMDDTSYVIDASVKSKSGDGEETASAAANINVFKPELTFKDSTVYYGTAAPTSYAGNKQGEVIWKHGNTKSTNDGVTMTGTEPELNISYTPAAYDKDADSNSDCYKGGAISTKQDIPVNAAVKIDDSDVTEYVAFKHTDCDSDCSYDKDKEQFLIHVKTCSLTVTKTGGMDGEPYVMNIYKKDKNGTFALYTSMTIVGNASETVYELPAGTYSVQEDTNWAWRYKAPVISDAVALGNGSPAGDITVTNQNRDAYYLNSYSTVVKNVLSLNK